jgi:predicted protein tyrosine phosphatase
MTDKTEKQKRIIITRADEMVKTLDTAANDNSAAKVIAVLSIEHPGVERGAKGSAPRLDETPHAHVPQMVLSFWDSEQVVHQGPDIQQVEAGLVFVMEHLAKNEDGSVLIHCHAGKSRSVALALGALSLLHPEKPEMEILDLLLEIRPIAAPNIIMVEMLDTLTGREGRLLQAVLDHPVIDAQRKKTEQNRQDLLRERPEILQKMHPEKFFPPPKP